MPFGLLVSLAFHTALIAWAVFSMRSVDEFPTEDTPIISAELVKPSEFLRLKQGSEDAKHLETRAKDETEPEDSKKDKKRPDKSGASAPPPEPIGPTPEEQKQLEEKIEEERKAAAAARAKEEAAKKAAEAEAKKKAAKAEAKKKAEEARQKAAAEAKKKAEAKKRAEAEKKRKAEEARKRKLAEARRKKRAAEARRRAAAKKKFDADELSKILSDIPDDGRPKALLDKDPRERGMQASGSSQVADARGLEAGTATGTDSVLSAREQDLLKGMIRSQLQSCWRLPGAGGGTETPVVTLRWQLKPNGELAGEPRVQSAPSDYMGQVASEAAVRAVKLCQPYRLPAKSYEAWKDIIWVFDPRQML